MTSSSEQQQQQVCVDDDDSSDGKKKWLLDPVTRSSRRAWSNSVTTFRCRQIYNRSAALAPVHITRLASFHLISSRRVTPGVPTRVTCEILTSPAVRMYWSSSYPSSRSCIFTACRGEKYMYVWNPPLARWKISGYAPDVIWPHLTRASCCLALRMTKLQRSMIQVDVSQQK